MTTKLNQKGKNTTTNIVAVAAKRGQKLAVSANGNLQFKKEPLLSLYEIAVSTFFGRSTFYKSSDDIVQRLRTNVRQAVNMGAYDFVANLAIHARGEMNIRTIPIVMVVEFAKALSDARTSGEAQNYANMRKLVCDVIQRADQITDLYAYALSVFGSKNKIPMAIKRGVADAFNKFDEYHFAKYNRNNEVKFRDVLRIVHPKAVDEAKGVVFEKIMKDTLEIPYTWETQLSTNGQLPTSERKTDKQLWTELVSSGKMGYMALLRNLRNIAQANLDATVLKKHVLDVISDRDNVLKSKQLPFDLLQAYNIVKALNGRMSTAVSKALDHSVTNMPKLGNKIWIIGDYSGSMSGMPYETATLLMAALLKANEEHADQLAVTMFGSSAKTINSIDTNGSVFDIQRRLQEHRRGNIAGSTNFGAAMQEYSKLGFVPDTIVVCSDNEVDGFPYRYVKEVTGTPDVVKLAINFEASPSTPTTKEDGWFAVAGWSTAMFKFVPAIREKMSVVDQLSGPYVGVKAKRKPKAEQDE